MIQEFNVGASCSRPLDSRFNVGANLCVRPILIHARGDRGIDIAISTVFRTI